MQSKDSIFTKIIKREISAEIVWEDDVSIAFLDINPVANGHTLLVPKKQVGKFYELEDSIYVSLLTNAKFLSKKIEQAFKCKRVVMLIEGFGVPDHVHIHLIPADDGHGIIFKRQDNPMNLKEVGDLLRKSINS